MPHRLQSQALGEGASNMGLQAAYVTLVPADLRRSVTHAKSQPVTDPPTDLIKSTVADAANAERPSDQITQKAEPKPAAPAQHQANAVTAPLSELVAAGASNGDQTLLQQISRCFPSGQHPSLPANMLDIQVDESGNLSAVPVVEIDLAASSPDQIKSANLIIQATLQCGPYALPTEASKTMRLVADFGH